MDHKEVIPASYQDFDDKSEESESEEDENGEEEDVFEAEEALSGLVYKPLLPGGGDDELDDVEDMESFEEGAVCPLTPLLPYRVREIKHLSEGECWLPSVERTERDEEDQGREERRAGEVAMDVIVLRPLGAVATAVGAGFWVSATPFMVFSPDEEFAAAGEAFVGERYRETFERPIGQF